MDLGNCRGDHAACASGSPPWTDAALEVATKARFADS